MKVFIISSSSFYEKIPPIQEYLEKKGIELLLPNTFENPNLEEETWEKGADEHANLIQSLFRLSEKKIKSVDAILCINYDKHGIENYIGGATFIEIYEAFKNNKKIFLYHDIPKGMLYDEISSFEPIVIHEDLDLIK